MPSQSWVALAPSLPLVDGTLLSNSTTVTSIGPAPVITVPANYLTTGSKLRWTARGRFSQATAVNVTLTLNVGGTGGVVLATTGAIAMAAATNLPWELEAITTVRSISGVASPTMTTGRVVGIVGASTVSWLPASAPATVNIDTTAAKTLDLVATLSNATNSSIQVHEWDIEILQ